MKCFSVLLQFILASISEGANNSSKPHIILFVVDDLGYADVGYHGSEIQTPHIDNLATTGVRLERYYVQAVCSPTRSTWMTGRSIHHTGYYTVLSAGSHGHLPTSPTLAEKFRDAGYKTHMLGKWHLGYDRWNSTPTGRGFSTHFGYFQGAEDYYTKMAHGGFDFWDNSRPAYEYQGGYSLTQYMNRAKQLITEHDQTEPFFLYFAHQTIHAPILGLPEPLKTKYEARCSSTTNALRIKYCSMMSYLDDTMDEFVHYLTDAKMWDNTLMLFTTDNGGMVPINPLVPQEIKGAGCNYPLRAGKATTFEGGVRGTAFFVGGVLPNDARGTVAKGLMHSTDVYSTLLATAGITSLDATTDGVNQLPMVMQGLPSARTSIVLSVISTSGAPAIIEGDMKLIQGRSIFDGYWTCADQKHHRVPFSGWPHGVFHEQFLFNLTADPREQHNLFTQMPDMASHLAQLLEEAKATAVDAQPGTADPHAADWQKAHNNTLGPWADDDVEFGIVV